MNDKFLKPYNPSETEDRIYEMWQKDGFFNPDVSIQKKVINEDAPAFSIVLPPPNVTGTLHLGHAFEDTIQDIIVRFERMRGKKTLWIPGTDHAAIATQSKVESILYKEEGKRKHDLGREAFLERVNEFAAKSHDTIVNQVKKVGASVDWSREAFTLDKKRNFAVRTAFKKMYDDGLIYRGYRIINWDPKGQTTVSDDEVVHEETKGKLYTFKYAQDFPISIATTRPETKVGDTAVAVNPDDARYNSFIGKTYNVVFAGVPLEIKIVGDAHVDPAFGTGAVGITPAHSITDAEIAERHKLPTKQVINEFGKMMVGGELLENKKTLEARDIIVEWLSKEQLLEKTEDITLNITKAERSGGVIEPLPKLQWFVAVNKKFTLTHSTIPGIQSGSETTLKEIMLATVQSGAISIMPDRFVKTYFHWIENLRDWCISRQLWYGHQIPVWYKGEEIYCGMEAPTGEGWTQDSDTLDTWFSSGLWTFSTLGWPEKTKDLETYHPTTLLCPGYEILFFWVARMILMSGYLLGTIPFKTVYLHGIVRDQQGRKFSKSLNNGIDPLDVIKDYGADALRMSLIIGNGPGNDSKFDISKVKGYKNFANKLWNITRFILTSTSDTSYTADFSHYSETDKTLKSEFDALITEITKEMEEYKFYIVGEKLYHYAWHRFADTILEESKKIFLEGTPEQTTSRKQLLLYILRTLLVTLHPFMPFITEEIWGSTDFGKNNTLIIEKWPN